ncbi:MAG: AAA family ATPase, partial [Candidatus Eremiobacteraeota bacterium]|nr:AAA family ATPase [Candidatus Eremiobacteraeota bacterium]
MIHRPVLCRRFIGRGEELAYLHEWRRDAGASRGGVVLIAGEAGLGKSRLLREFSAPLQKSRWRVAPAPCLEFGQRPYGPILDALARLDPAAAEVVPAASKHEQFEALAAAFTRVVARGAVLVIVEDLHWADVATLEFLLHLSPRLATMRMLLVTSFRPEEVPPEHPAGAAVARLARAVHAGRVDLGPLDDAERESFIDAALDGIPLPQSARRTVARASEGNPFFIEELLKSAVERREARAPAVPSSLPPTLNATLLERLRPLSETDRRVVAHASVIGRSFELPLLAETLGTAVESLLPALRRARDLQLIEEASPQLFRFRHALTREAIYGGFLGAEVRALHRRIALAIEKEGAERSVESLAYHWSAAGDSERTARYNVTAGDAAAALNAHDDAIAFYVRAVEALGDDDAARAAVLEKIAQRQIALAQYGGAAAATLDAANAYAAAGDLDAEARCRVSESLQKYTLGRPEPTRDLVAMLARLPEDAALPRARLHVGIAWMAASFYETSLATQHLDAVDVAALRCAP